MEREHSTESEASAQEAVSTEAFTAYLEADRRAALTRVDAIDGLLGRSKRRSVKCPNCGHVFDSKRSGVGAHGS